MSEWLDLVPQSIKDRYELHNFNNAVEILASSGLDEYQEIIKALNKFIITKGDIMKKGGNESDIPKKLSTVLRPLGWKETKISGDLLLKLKPRHGQVEERIIENFVEGYNIDYVKKRVAMDMEWNSKDQTFDRDLYAFSAFYKYNIIDCVIIITRSEKLNPIFHKLGIKNKYGASTTWMGKLLPRISSGRNSGCPLLVIGITPQTLENKGEFE